MKKILALFTISSLLSLSGAFLYMVPEVHATTTLEVGSGQTYATIQAAVDAIPDSPTNLSDSYVINVHSGTYAENVTISNKLTTPTETITVKNNTGDSPVISNATGKGFTVTSVSHVTIDGFEITGGQGGISILGDSSNNVIQNNTIHGITDQTWGILLQPQSASDSSSNTIIQNNIIYNGLSGTGANGVFMIPTANTTMDNNIVRNNVVYSVKAALNLQAVGSPTSMDGNVFKNNLVYQNTIGISSSITISGSQTTIESNTVYKNLCGGIASMSPDSGNPTIIKNNIVTGNSYASGCNTALAVSVTDDAGLGGIAIVTDAGAYQETSYNLVYDNGYYYDTSNENVVEVTFGGYPTMVRGSYYGSAAAIDAISVSGANFSNTLVVDPLYSDVDGLDNTLGYSAGNYGVDDDFTLQSGSPAIDAGDPASTYSNEPDPNGSRINLGAYGNTVYAALSPASSDVNLSASVDPALSFTIRNSADSGDTNTCSFGSMSTGSVNTCAYRLAIETNATAGFTAQIQADGGFLSGSDQIDDIAEDGTVTAGTEGYGIAVTGATAGSASSGGVTEAGNFTDDDTPLPTSATNLVSVSEPFAYTSGDTTTSTLITHRAGIAATTPAGTYTQTLTYTVTGNF